MVSVLATVLLGACAAVSGLDAFRAGPGGADASGDLGPSLDTGPQTQPDATESTPEAGGEPEDAGGPQEAEAACVDGSCPVACSAGTNLCNGACIEYSSPSNCGSCGNVCPRDAGVCSPSGDSYECTPDCATPSMLCSGSCADVTSDVDNCSRCGKACTTGVANAAPACVASKCAFTCNTGFSLCNGACVNEQADDNNCGGCGSGHVCAAGLSCQSGACALSQASPACTACLLANCNTQTTAVDTDPLAIAVANCALENKCVNTCCFCSGGPCASCTGYGDGPCRAVIEMAAGVESPSVCTTDGPTLSTNCQNSSNSCGKANILATCEVAMCQSQCMAATCN